MVCHCSLHAIDSLKPSEKNWTSSGSNRPYARLYLTCPTSPLSQVCTLAEAERGSLSSVKVGCQLGAAPDEEAASAPPQAVGWGPLTSFRIMILPEGRGVSFCRHITRDPK